jgi:hypothetical protein
LHEWAERVFGRPSNPHRIMTDAETYGEWARRLEEEDLIDHDEIRRQLIDADLWIMIKDPKVIEGTVIESWIEGDRPDRKEIEP